MRASAAIAVLSLFGCLVACGVESGPLDGRRAALPPPTRGYVLISLDTLRADRLGAYGYDKATSPFFDRLAAERGVLFERALAPYPSTLVSHMSMFTALYPPQHGVYPPSRVLPESIATLPQRFRAAGFRTQGHTEGGFVGRGYGFERGFEVYDDTGYAADTDIERTFARGVAFLRSLEPGERFFLFLHSYSIHDPYDPPDPFVETFGDGSPGPDSGGERIRAFNHGETGIEAEEVARFSRRYDASIRYVDGVLEKLVGELDALALLADTTLIVTSDHGEEFLEHGKLGHTQLFPEVLAVPLLVVHPDLAGGRRVADQVGLVDLAPTLLEVAGLTPLEGVAGRSFAPRLTVPDARPGELHYVEIDETPYLRGLIGEVDGVRYQLLVDEVKGDPEGAWVRERAAFDHFGRRLELRGRSYHEPRRVEVVVDGAPAGVLDLTPEWGEFAVDLPSDGLQRVELRADGCARPADLGESGDRRCLSFIVQGPPLATAVLYDLDSDPGAHQDISRARPLIVRRLLRELQARQWAPMGKTTSRELFEEDERRLRNLGYLD